MMYNRLRTLSNILIAIGIVLLVFALVGVGLVDDILHYLVEAEEISAFSLFSIKVIILCVPLSFLGIAIALRAVNKEMFEDVLAEMQMSDNKK